MAGDFENFTYTHKKIHLLFHILKPSNLSGEPFLQFLSRRDVPHAALCTHLIRTHITCVPTICVRLLPPLWSLCEPEAMFHHFVSLAPGMAPSICKVRSCKTTAILTSLIHIRKCDFMNSRVLGGTGQICLPQILVSIKERKYMGFCEASGSLLQTSITFAPLAVEVPRSVFNRSHTQTLDHFHVSGAWQCLHTEDEWLSKGSNAQFSVPF